MGERGEVAEFDLIVTSYAICFADGREHLGLFDGIDAQIGFEIEIQVEHWCRHLREPVRFQQGIQALRALDIDVCLEIGPDRTLINLITDAGLLPPKGGVASLRCGADDRVNIRDAARSLHELGQEFAWTAGRAASSQLPSAAPLHPSALTRSRTKTSARTVAGTRRADEWRVA